MERDDSKKDSVSFLIIRYKDEPVEYLRNKTDTWQTKGTFPDSPAKDGSLIYFVSEFISGCFKV